MAQAPILCMHDKWSSMAPNLYTHAIMEVVILMFGSSEFGDCDLSVFLQMCVLSVTSVLCLVVLGLLFELRHGEHEEAP
jgi:hypothetical protein